MHRRLGRPRPEVRTRGLRNEEPAAHAITACEREAVTTQICSVCGLKSSSYTMIASGGLKQGPNLHLYPLEPPRAEASPDQSGPPLPYVGLLLVCVGRY